MFLCYCFAAQTAKWTHAAVLLLIAEHSEKKDLFASSAVRKTEVWSKIATVMKAHGHHMNADACDEKFEEYVSTVNF